jgi:hypothetical protein
VNVFTFSIKSPKFYDSKRISGHIYFTLSSKTLGHYQLNHSQLTSTQQKGLLHTDTRDKISRNRGATAATATLPPQPVAAHKEKTNTNEKFILASSFFAMGSL